VRAAVRDAAHLCQFEKANSKKCTYCTKQKAECVPVSFLSESPSDKVRSNFSKIPWFCGPEFEAFLSVQGGDENVVVDAAKTLIDVVAVAAAEAPRGVNGALFALMEEVRSLRGVMVEQRDEIMVGVGAFSICNSH
jgi:hypothetical protein